MQSRHKNQLTLAVLISAALSLGVLTATCFQAGGGLTDQPISNRVNLPPPAPEPANPVITGPLESPRALPLSRYYQRVTIMAVGDVMTHVDIIRRANNLETNQYDFEPYFEYVAPILRQADWVFGNLETKLAGKKNGYTGYPLFNAPGSLAVALANSGFTFLSTANNHTLDRWKDGLLRTNQTLDETGLRHTGTFSGPEDRATIRVLRKNGISLAVLAYSYGTNGIPVPQGDDYLVNYIDFDRIGRDLAAARRCEVDFICCMVHFGSEYVRVPDSFQKAVTAKLQSLGVDIVLGSHPHVVQPIRLVADGQKKQLVAYSLGNFLADQGLLYTKLGVILKFTLAKNSAGDKTIIDVETKPTWVIPLVKDGRPTFRIYPIKELLARPEAYGLPELQVNQLRIHGPALEAHLHSIP